MEKTNQMFGIVLCIDTEPEQYLLDEAKKEYDLDDEQLAKFKEGRMFRLSDYFQYYAFDTDIVLVDEDTENYYQLQGSYVSSIDDDYRKRVIALIDENGEANFI